LKKKTLFYSLPVILLFIFFFAGWLVTDYLGNKARQDIIGENRASALTLSIYVSSALNTFEGAVKSLAGSPWIYPSLLSKGTQGIEQANSALDRYNSALNASVSYLMDAHGMTVAASNRNDPDSFVGKSYRFRPYFQEASKGNPDRYFALGITSGKRGFYASYPVKNHTGKVIGVVTMKKDLDEMETFFSKHASCSLISPDGIIFLSSTPSMVLKSLWPLDKAAQEKLIASRQFGNKPFEAVLQREIADDTEVTLKGNNYFVSRTVIGSGGWSIVVLTPTDRIRIYKWIGILATISVCLLILIFSGVIYVTDRSKEAIRQSEELHKTLAEKSIAGVYVVQDGKFRFINSNAASYAGYTREELLNRKASILVSPEDSEKVRQNARAMLLGEQSSPYEFRIVTKQGETRWIMETVTSILHEGRPAILGNSMDITDHKNMEEEIRTLSVTDPLTGLYNRRGFLAIAEQQLKIAARTKIGLLLLFADLDGMKWINDHLGHKKGDEALIEAGDVLKGVFREADVVARVGGDEFCVLAVGISIENLSILENRLQEQIGINNSRENRDYSLSMSIGMVFNDSENPSTIDELMARADVLMYEQKKGKRS
jgi:diguanylate cyclase (GGDEF)-like protein/PAS domain S-box-containing protein